MSRDTIVETAGRENRAGPTDRPVSRGWRTIVRDTVGETIYRLAVAGSARLPLRTAQAAGRALGRLEYRVRGRGVQLRPEVLEELGAGEAEITAWTRRSCELSVCEDVDYYRYRRTRGGRIEELIDLRGVEHLDAALARGCGAILYSGHIRGHYTFFCSLPARGYPTNVISCHPEEHHTGVTLRCFGRCQDQLRHRMGLRFIWLRPGNFGIAVQAANALRRNEIVILEIDALGASALETDLFGRPALFSSGHVALAQSTGAPLLDFFVHRDEDWRQVGEIGAPFEASTDTVSSVRKSLSRLETHALRHPEVWYLTP